jgi:hypothetical protein
MPRWLRARPFLLVTALSWRNLQRRYRWVLPAILVLAVGCACLLTLPGVGAILDLAAQYPVTPFVLLAAGCAVLTVRRKTHVYRSLVDSWLAPLAASPSVVVRMLFAPVLQVVLLWLALAIATLAGSLGHTAAVTLGLIVGAAYIAGFIVGWVSPHGRAVGAPDFHYVAIRKPRMNWAQAPSLVPLSYWAVGQARVSTKPKVTGGAMLFVLLALPMGTGGEKAVAIAAGSWVAFYLFSLVVSAVRVAFSAARWLVPTTLRYLPFTRAVGYRVVLTQLWVGAWMLFFATASGLPGLLGTTLSLMGRCLLTSCIAIPAACWIAMRAQR